MISRSGAVLRRVSAGALGWGALAAMIGAQDFRSPGTGSAFRAGETATIAWEPVRDAEIDEIELVLSVDGGITFPVRVTPELPGGASRFRWRVPELPTKAARLALRTGREGDRGSERIVVVSGLFEIRPGGESRGAGLIRGAIEWWTDQALRDVAAEDWLGDRMSGRPTWHASASSESDADETDPEPHPSRSTGRERARSSAVDDGLTFASPAPLRRSAPVPLRV